MHKQVFLLYTIRFRTRKIKIKEGDCKNLINCYEKSITLTLAIVHGSKVFGSYNSPIKFH